MGCATRPFSLAGVSYNCWIVYLFIQADMFPARALTSCRCCLSKGLLGAGPPAGSFAQTWGCHSRNKSPSHTGIPPPYSQAPV